MTHSVTAAPSVAPVVFDVPTLADVRAVSILRDVHGVTADGWSRIVYVCAECYSIGELGSDATWQDVLRTRAQFDFDCCGTGSSLYPTFTFTSTL